MMEIHVPVPDQVENLIRYITEGLDAVVLLAERSTIYPNFLMLEVAGNSRDLAIATERASKVGGVVN